MNHFKKKLTAFTAMLAFLSLSCATVSADEFFGAGANAGATANQWTSNMHLNQQNNTLNVDIRDGHGGVGQVDWGKFGVRADEIVNFRFSGLSQTIINRVLGGAKSEIYGTLLNGCIDNGTCGSYAQTGKVILINPAGVLFGAGSKVDINSFTVSTFDFKNAKNLNNLGESEADYLARLKDMKGYAAKKADGTSIIDPNTKQPLVYDYNRTLEFDRSKVDNFEAAGIENFNHSIDFKGTQFENLGGKTNFNKSIVAVTDKITYRDSLLKTGSNLNYNDNQSFGNINLITADGVSYTYLANGYADKYNLKADDGKVERYIDIDNSVSDDLRNEAIAKGNEIAFDNGIIESGKVDIVNKNDAGALSTTSKINISNAIVKANKLVAQENGDIYIVGSNGINIDKSQLLTKNTTKTLASGDYTTVNQNGGEIFVKAGGALKISDSTLKTEGATAETQNAENAGNIRLSSVHKTTVDNSTLAAEGDLKVDTTMGIKIKNSLLQAKNNTDPSVTKDVVIHTTGDYGGTAAMMGEDIGTYRDIDIENSTVFSTGNIDIVTNMKATPDATGEMGKFGNIIIHSTYEEGEPITNKTFLITDGRLSIQAGGTDSNKAIFADAGVTEYDTEIDNATLAYGDLTFNIDDEAGKNNVIIKNNSTFTEYDKNPDGSLKFNEEGKKIATGNINLTTNGNMTLDNATVKTASFDIPFVNNVIDREIGINYTPTNANDVTVTSIQGDARAINSTDVNAAGKITLLANAENASVEGSNLTAMNVRVEGQKNVSIVSANSKDSSVTATNNIGVYANTGDVTISSEGNEEETTINAGNNAVVQATEGSVTIKDNADVQAGNDATVQAAKNTVKILDNTKLHAGNNILVKALKTIKFGKKPTADEVANPDGPLTTIENTTEISAGKTIEFVTDEDIISEKTETGTLTYGDRLKFRAEKGSNNFTSKDSLKSVNVDYIAKNNNFDTKGDIQFVNSTIKGNNNNITTEAGDVILNKAKLRTLDVANKDATTRITANGNVTTADITGTSQADKDAVPHTFPQSVDVNRVEAPADTTLDVGETKLIVKTNTVKDPLNPSNGSVSLKMINTTRDAGVEITAENYLADGTQKWDENSGWSDPEKTVSEGPLVTITSGNSKAIAISKIITDKLHITRGTKITAAPVDLTGTQLEGFEETATDAATGQTQGYIEVRDYLGFNQDDDFTKLNPEDYDYLKHYVPDKKTIDGVEVDINKKHIITYNENDPNSKFMLVYDRIADECIEMPWIDDKTNQPVEPAEGGEETVTLSTPMLAQAVYSTPAARAVHSVKLPRETKEISYSSTIIDNKAYSLDAVAAAAKIEVESNKNDKREVVDVQLQGD